MMDINRGVMDGCQDTVELKVRLFRGLKENLLIYRSFFLDNIVSPDNEANPDSFTGRKGMLRSNPYNSPVYLKFPYKQVR
jgi:hypothetical protein